MHWRVKKSLQIPKNVKNVLHPNTHIYLHLGMDLVSILVMDVKIDHAMHYWLEIMGTDYEAIVVFVVVGRMDFVRYVVVSVLVVVFGLLVVAILNILKINNFC